MAISIAAIVLAAGKGNRMGRIKPLLPLGERTVIAHIAGSFQAAGIADIVVVLGYRCDDIIPELRRNNLRWIRNDRYEQGMLSSVKSAIQRLARDAEAFFIMPADIPLVRPATLKELMKAYGAQPGQVVYPAFEGQRGHPPLIPACFREGILAYDGPGGLRRCLKTCEDTAVDVKTGDQGILIDMDIPEDYEDVLKRLKTIDMPNRQEAWALLKIFQQGNPRVMAHAKAVAGVAAAIAKALRKAGLDVNVALIEAAALLHDIARGQSHHDRRGAEWLAARGFQTVADVVGQHMDLVFEPLNGIDEAEVVFLADKMVSGSDIVPLEKRLLRKKEQFNDNPDALQSMTFRMAQAFRIRQAVEDLTGQTVEALQVQYENMPINSID